MGGLADWGLWPPAASLIAVALGTAEALTLPAAEEECVLQEPALAFPLSDPAHRPWLVVSAAASMTWGALKVPVAGLPGAQVAAGESKSTLALFPHCPCMPLPVPRCSLGPRQKGREQRVGVVRGWGARAAHSSEGTCRVNLGPDSW